MNTFLLIIRIFLLATLVWTLSACGEEGGDFRTLRLRIVMPEGYEHITPSGRKVVLSGLGGEMRYEETTDASGTASFRVECGFYAARVHFVFRAADDPAANEEHIFSGRLEHLDLSPATSTEVTATLPLEQSRLSRLVIREVYYGGCRRADGKSYIKDSYIILHNNSEEAVSLDSLCLGTVAPVTSAKPSPWMLYTDMKRLPVNMMGWQFVAEDKERLMLPPGGSVTVAMHAVNHRGEGYNQPNSVDLSQVGWGFWDAGLQHAISPGVQPLRLFWKGQATQKAYSFAVTGSTFFLYRIAGRRAEVYAAEAENIETEPHATSAILRFLMIPTEWVLDCVECVGSAAQLTNKHVPASLDASACYLPMGNFQGYALRRKMKQQEDGRVIYQDTNNSAEDFEVVKASSPSVTRDPLLSL